MLDIGGRSAVPGYGGGDSTRQKFTSKERDSESGLDYFGARYYSSAQGRFTCVDPLVSSGLPDDPQTWNRFTYTLGNPLKYTDQLGLYVFGQSVTEEQREEFRAGLQKARDALNGYKEGSKEYKQLNRVLDLYGKEGVKNGVIIVNREGVGAGRTMVDGVQHEKTKDNPTGQKIQVAFDAETFETATFAQSIAHEGVHAADGSEWVASGFAEDKLPTRYQTEFDAYFVTSLVAQQLNPKGNFYASLKLTLFPKNPKLKMPYRIDLWNSSWAAADVATLRANNINHLLSIPKKEGGDYGLAPSSKDKPFAKGQVFP